MREAPRVRNLDRRWPNEIRALDPRKFKCSQMNIVLDEATSISKTAAAELQPLTLEVRAPMLSPPTKSQLLWPKERRCCLPRCIRSPMACPTSKLRSSRSRHNAQHSFARISPQITRHSIDSTLLAPRPKPSLPLPTTVSLWRNFVSRLYRRTSPYDTRVGCLVFHPSAGSHGLPSYTRPPHPPQIP